MVNKKYLILLPFLAISCGLLASTALLKSDITYNFSYYESITEIDAIDLAEKTANLPSPRPGFSSSYFAGEIVLDKIDGDRRGDLIVYDFTVNLKIESKSPASFREFKPVSYAITYELNMTDQSSSISAKDARNGDSVSYPMQAHFFHCFVMALSHDKLQHKSVESFDLPNNHTQYIRTPLDDTLRSTGSAADLFRWTSDPAGQLKDLVVSREYGNGEVAVLSEISIRSVD